MMRRACAQFLLLAFLWLQTGAAVATDPALVLVANANSPIKVLTKSQARKLYLGELIRVDGRVIVPLRNNSDQLLQEVFMQRVMYMATETYERQILNRVFRAGGQRPSVYSDFTELTDALKNDSMAVSYMWSKAALATSGLKVVGQ